LSWIVINGIASTSVHTQQELAAYLQQLVRFNFCGAAYSLGLKRALH
jgi:hypothetical protein